MKKSALCFLTAALICGAQAEKRPNFLFILTDDQSPFDLRMYNPDSNLDTPNLDRIAQNGVIFDGAYHMGSYSGAVCNPSRHQIMSGRTVWNLPKASAKGVPGWQRNCPPNLEQNTIGAIFNRAGYDTMRTCKKGNSYEGANEQFTIRFDATKRDGTPEGGSEWHGNRVLEYLDAREKSGDSDPFMIYYGFSHPHDPRNGTEELLKKYGATNNVKKGTPPTMNPERPAPALPVTYLPKHPFHHGHLNLRDEEKVAGVWTNRDAATIRNEMGREFACSENVDIQIGKVLDKLQEMGELENTYVIYTADHGIAVGRHGLTGKQNLYEHTWRVPYLVMGPGVQKGERVQGNIYLLDTLRTLLDLAKIDVPDSVEGRSFKPVLTGEKEQVRDALYGVYCGGTKPGMRAIRKGDWKLIKYDVLDGKVRETQLFNLKENPNELLKEHHDPEVVAMIGNKPNANQVNLADDPRYAEKRKELEALLLAEQIRHNDPYRLWDQPKK